MSAEAEKPDYDSEDDEEDEELKASGKVCLIVDWQGDKSTFHVKQTAAWSKVRGGAAAKWKLQPDQIKLLSNTGILRQNKDDHQTLKMSGLEAGRTYRMSVELEQQGGDGSRQGSRQCGPSLD